MDEYLERVAPRGMAAECTEQVTVTRWTGGENARYRWKIDTGWVKLE